MNQATSPTDPLTRKLSAFTSLRPEDAAFLEKLLGPRICCSAGKEIIYEGQHRHSAYLLHEGWTCSYKRLHDGARQIIDVQIPGDFLGARSLPLRASDQSFVALTDVEISRISTEKLWEAFRNEPRLALALLWATARDGALVVEHLAGIGRRDALTRTAHFLLELGARMKLVGRGTADSYSCPLSQNILADALGLTAIHLNRVLRQMREANLLVFRDGVVTFLDRETLAEITGFDLAYLDQSAPAR